MYPVFDGVAIMVSATGPGGLRSSSNSSGAHDEGQSGVVVVVVGGVVRARRARWHSVCLSVRNPDV